MTLPDELAQQFNTELYLLDEESNMKYVTSFERMAKQEGRQEGIWESIIELLTIRFGPDLDETAVQLKQINDVDTLRALRKQAITANSLQEFMQSIPSVS